MLTTTAILDADSLLLLGPRFFSLAAMAAGGALERQRRPRLVLDDSHRPLSHRAVEAGEPRFCHALILAGHASSVESATRRRNSASSFVTV